MAYKHRALIRSLVYSQPLVTRCRNDRFCSRYRAPLTESGLWAGFDGSMYSRTLGNKSNLAPG